MVLQQYRLFILLFFCNSLFAMQQSESIITSPLYIARDQQDTSPKFLIDSHAIPYSTVLNTVQGLFIGESSGVISIAQWFNKDSQFSDEQLHFLAEFLNFLYREQHGVGRLQADRILEYIRLNTDSYRLISFSMVLELIVFFDIAEAFSALTAVQPLSLPTTPEQEVEYNKQLVFVFSLAKSTTQGARDEAVKDSISQGPLYYKITEKNITVGSEKLWQLFGRMLYPRCTNYPEIVRMLNFITAQQGGLCTHIIRRIGQKVGSWLGAYACGRIVQKRIEHMVVSGYMQQHPSLYRHVAKVYKNVLDVVFSPDGSVMALLLKNNSIMLLNHYDGFIIRIIDNDPQLPVFSPDGQIIAVKRGSRVDLIRVYDGSVVYSIEDIAACSVYNNGQERQCSVVFSPDGKIVAVNRNGAVVCISLPNSSMQNNAVFMSLEKASAPLFSPDGRMIALQRNGDVELIDMQNGALIGSFRNAYSTFFSPDSHILVLEKGKGVELVTVADGRVIRTITDCFPTSFSPDGRMIVVNKAFRVTFVDIYSGLPVLIFNNAFPPLFSIDGRIITIERNGAIEIVSMPDGRTVSVIQKACCPLLSRDGNLLISHAHGAVYMHEYVSLREALAEKIV